MYLYKNKNIFNRFVKQSVTNVNLGADPFILIVSLKVLPSQCLSHSRHSVKCY